MAFLKFEITPRGKIFQFSDILHILCHVKTFPKNMIISFSVYKNPSLSERISPDRRMQMLKILILKIQTLQIGYHQCRIKIMMKEIII